MAILWDKSLIPWTDRNGDPYAGAKAYFFDAQTTTPQIVYKEADLSIPHDHPVVANADGEFPPVFLVEQTSHRVRITTADDVTVWDVDGVSVPTTVPPDPPSGETPAEYLYQTGDIKMAWRVSAPTGYVRCNGRSVGAPSSGASERANDDCEALFKFLWNNDPNLAVSGGRGATADGDWSAAKRIDLPDFRGRVPVGMDGMGNADAGRVTDDQLGKDSNTLGSDGGSAVHTLTVAEMPEHKHSVSGTAQTAGEHTHNIKSKLGGAGAPAPAWQTGPDITNFSTDAAGAHTHNVTGEAANVGGGVAHNNLQPSLIVPFFIKL